MCGVSQGCAPWGLRGVHSLSQERQGLAHQRGNRRNFFCLEVYVFRLHLLAVATPILATILFPEMTGRQLVTFPDHQTLLGMYLKCLFLVLSPIDWWGTDVERVKCNFLVKLYKWHAYI